MIGPVDSLAAERLAISMLVRYGDMAGCARGWHVKRERGDVKDLASMAAIANGAAAAAAAAAAMAAAPPPT